MRVLPCVVMFVGGVAVDRIVGFEPLGATDDFPTSQVPRLLCPPCCLPAVMTACWGAATGRGGINLAHVLGPFAKET